MLDTVMVGQLGSVDIAAAALGNQVFFVMTIMQFGIVSGGSIFISQYWGKKDLSGVHRTMGITLSAATVISVLFFLIAFFIPDKVLSLYTKDVLVIERGAAYLRTVSPSYILIGIGFAFAHALRSTERVVLPTAATAVATVLNAVLNYVFIFGFSVRGKTLILERGLVGAAIATDISRIVEFLILIIIPYVKHYEAAVNPKYYFQTQTGFFARYVRIAFPVFFNECLWGIGVSVQNSIYGHSGTDVIAAFNIMNTNSSLIWTFFIGCGNAAAIIIGKKIGEGSRDESVAIAKRLVKFMALCAAGLAVLLIPLALLLPYFFKVEPEVISMARVFILMTAALYPLFAVCMCMVVGVCRSGGDTLYATIMDIGFMWAISIPLGFLAVSVFHLPFWAIFLCLHSEDIFKTTMGLIRLKSGKWLHDVTN
jgi:putative MATE family efflux protein